MGKGDRGALHPALEPGTGTGTGTDGMRSCAGVRTRSLCTRRRPGMRLAWLRLEVGAVGWRGRLAWQVGSLTRPACRSATMPCFFRCRPQAGLRLGRRASRSESSTDLSKFFPTALKSGWGSNAEQACSERALLRGAIALPFISSPYPGGMRPGADVGRILGGRRPSQVRRRPLFSTGFGPGTNRKGSGPSIEL